MQLLQAKAFYEEKYAALASSHTFIPNAINTMGPKGSKASYALQELGRRLSLTTGNHKSLQSYFSDCLLLFQRCDAMCIRDTFGAGHARQ